MKGEQLQSELSSVQSVSHVQLFATPWAAVHKSSLSITNFWSLLKHMSIELVMLSNHLILCGPLLLFSIFPRIKLFSNELILHISEFTLQSELVFSKSEVVSGWDLEMVYCHFLLIHLAKKTKKQKKTSFFILYWNSEQRKSDRNQTAWKKLKTYFQYGLSWGAHVSSLHYSKLHGSSITKIWDSIFKNSKFKI